MPRLSWCLAAPETAPQRQSVVVKDLVEVGGGDEPLAPVQKLFRVGGAIFADTGRTWGDNPLGGESLGWLSDVGFGLRFAPTRTGTRSIIHLDIAFPLDGDPTIDSVQILLESKKGF